MDPIQVTNLCYLTLSLFMKFKNEPHSFLVFYIFLVSFLHHAYPKDRQLQRLDGTLANLSLLVLLPTFLSRKQKKSIFFWLSIELFALSLFCYVSCGDDFTSTKFVAYHSMWHVTSAFSLFLMCLAPNTIPDTRSETFILKK
jgi:hypothetical protein